MPKYQRWYREGGTYFFTVKTYKRQAFLCDAFARTIGPTFCPGYARYEVNQ